MAQFKLTGESKGGQFHVYSAFNKKSGGGKVYIPVKEGVEPKDSVNVTVK